MMIIIIVMLLLSYASIIYAIVWCVLLQSKLK